MTANATELTNYVEFAEDGKSLRGNIATISYDIDIAGEPYNSENPKAPVYRLFAKSPRGRRIEIGGIWKKQNQSGGEYHTHPHRQHRLWQAQRQSRPLSRPGCRKSHGRHPLGLTG